MTTETWKSNILAYIYFSANFPARSAKNTELGLADSTPDLEITLEACCVLFARPGQAGLSRTIQRRLSGDVERGGSGEGSEGQVGGCDSSHKLGTEIHGKKYAVHSVRQCVAD